MADVAIKLNNCECDDPCAVCGEWTHSRVGPELFLDGTWEPVCYECGRKHAPELVALLDTLQRHTKTKRWKPWPVAQESFTEEAGDGLDMEVWGEV